MATEEKMICSYDPKKGWEVEVTRDIPKVELSYHELRMVVMALYNQGTMLREPQLTFAHGNTGNDYQNLARRIDHVLSKLEKYHVIKLSAQDTRKKEIMDNPETWRGIGQEQKGAVPTPSNKKRARRPGNGKTAK